MSFIEQERALFDLLFDKPLRDYFIANGSACLTDYDLTQEEINDFNQIRPEAFELDCNIRTNLILSRICKNYPVSFTLLSACPDGITKLKDCLTSHLMRTPVIRRNVVFAELLMESIANFNFPDEIVRDKVIAFLSAERGMALTAASIKEAIQAGNEIPAETNGMLDNIWDKEPVKLAPYVSASILPQSYMRIKKSICKEKDSSLWRHLGNTPLEKKELISMRETDDPRLFVTRAYVESFSRFDPVIDQKTVELSEGFAFLFQYVDGSYSIEHILEQMQQTGAEGKMLDSIRATFKRLMEMGMIALN